MSGTSALKGGQTVGGVNSPYDIGAIAAAVGQNISELHNRYSQLGLGVPDPNVFGGDPVTAAAAGGNLQYGSPGSSELTDIAGAGLAGQAALGTLQNQNINNPAILGSAANIQQQNQQTAQNLQNILGQNQFSAGAQSQSG